MRLPLKFRILELIALDPGVSSVDIARRVADEYPGERQTKASIIEDHITAFQTNGIIACTPTAMEADGVLVQKLELTAYGVTRLRFLPHRARIDHQPSGSLQHGEEECFSLEGDS